MAGNLRNSINNSVNNGLRQSVSGGPGVIDLWILDGVPAVLPAEEAYNKYLFAGTAPFILEGSTTALATLVLNANA